MLLVDNKRRRHLITLAAGGQFHTHAGIVEHDDAHRPRRRRDRAHDDAARASSRCGRRSPSTCSRCRAARRSSIRRTSARSSCSPTSSRARASSSRASARARSRPRCCARSGATGRVTGYEIRDDFARRAPAATCTASSAPTCRSTSRCATSTRASTSSDLDRIVLDLPEPWRVVKHAVEALRPGGILLAYLPTILQVGRLREELAGSPFGMVETLEVLQRTLARRGPVDPARPPHGRAHRVPHPRAAARARPERGGERARRRRHRGRCSRAGVGGWRLGFVAARVRVGGRRGRPRRSASTSSRASSPRSAAPAPTTASRSRCCSSSSSRRSGRRSGSAIGVRRAPLRATTGQPLPRWDRVAGAAIGAVGVLVLVWMMIPSLATAEGLAGADGARLGASSPCIDTLAPDQPAQFAALGPRDLRRAVPVGARAARRPARSRAARPRRVIPAEVDARVRAVDREGQRAARAARSRRGAAGSPRPASSSPTRTSSRASDETTRRGRRRRRSTTRPSSRSTRCATSRCCAVPALDAPRAARSATGDGRRRRRGLRPPGWRAAARGAGARRRGDRRRRHRHLPHGREPRGTCSCSRPRSRPATPAARSSTATATVIGVAFAIDPGREGDGYALTDDEVRAGARHGRRRRRVDTGRCLVG